jgi:hypothetical protein
MLTIFIRFLKFIIGWGFWILIELINILNSVIFWNWKETLSLDMEIVVSQVLGKRTWNIMMFKK